MSPRPRKVSDDDVLGAALRVMGRRGPRDLTLAEIAREAGVTAGALVQRFGSKQALLQRLADAGSSGTAEMLAGLRAAHASPLEALLAYAECVAQLAPTPAAVVRNLAYLQQDIDDDALRAQLAKQSRVTRAWIGRLLADARREGALAATTDTAALARTIEAVLSGALLTWAIYQRGAASRWMRDAVVRALAPHR